MTRRAAQAAQAVMTPTLDERAVSALDRIATALEELVAAIDVLTAEPVATAPAAETPAPATPTRKFADTFDDLGS